MADWLSDPEDDDEEGTGGVVQALASPRTAFVSDDRGSVPVAVPQPVAKASAATPEPDMNRDADEEATGMAQPTQPKPAPKQQDETASDFMVPSPASGSQSSQSQEYDEETLTPPKVPVAPVLPSDAAPRQEYAQAIANFKPGDYKPSGWRRALAAIAGGLTAAGSRNPEAGMKVGESVLNSPLDRAKAAEAQKEQGLQQQIQAIDQERSNAQQGFSNRVQQFDMGERGLRDQEYAQSQRDLAADRRAQAAARQNAPVGFAPKDPMNPWAGGVVTTAGGKQIPNSAPPSAWLKDWSGTPQGKLALQQMTIQQREQAAKQMNLNPNETKFFVANGKLAEPSQHTTIAIRENPDGTPVQPKGRAGNPQNISDIVAKATQDKQAFIDGWTRIANEDDAKALGVKVGDYVKGTQTLSPQEMHDRIDKFRTDANVKLNKYGAHIDEQGNLHTEPGQPNLTPERTSPAAPARQQSPQGAPVVRFGNGQKLTDANIARQYLAKAGGDKNKARQLAEQDHWKL